MSNRFDEMFGPTFYMGEEITGDQEFRLQHDPFHPDSGNLIEQRGGGGRKGSSIPC